MKTCSKCKVDQPIEMFYRNHGNQCKPCLNIQAKNWVIKNPERRKAISKRHYDKQAHRVRRQWVLRRYFNMSIERYEEMLKEQEGKCAICSRIPDGSEKRKLAVDHDHKSGTVRALLCGECNRGLGLFKDDPELMQKAAKYLNDYRRSDAVR